MLVDVQPILLLIIIHDRRFVDDRERLNDLIAPQLLKKDPMRFVSSCHLYIPPKHGVTSGLFYDIPSYWKYLNLKKNKKTNRFHPLIITVF